MYVPSYDMAIRRGNDCIFGFRLKSRTESGQLVPFDLSGSTVVFFAERADGSKIERTLVPDDPQTGVVSVSFTVEDSRLFTPGRENRWEIERRAAGSETTLIRGYIISIESVNDDA